MSSAASGSGKRSSKGKTPKFNRSAAALHAAMFNSRRHRRDRSRSRSPRYESSRASVPRSESPESGSSGSASHAGGSGDGTPRPNRNDKISHILIKHRDSRRPIDSNDRPVTRTKDQAMAKVIDIHQKISRDLITFADAAVSYSECTSGRRQGDIQKQFQFGRVLKSFEDAASFLGPGEVSHVIESSSGYHILQRRE